jgi:phosphoserine phosphatase
MDTVLVLIARPGSGAIDDAVLKAVRRIVPGEPRWLAQREAVELPLTGSSASAARPREGGDPVSSRSDGFPLARERADHVLEHSVRGALADRPIDVAVLPAVNRRKKLLIADMDSTIIEQEVVDELAAIAGIGEAISAITARAMKGEIEFEPALRERVALLKGLPATAIEQVIRERITFAPGGRMLVSTMKARGAFTAIVSGGFVPFTRHVAETIGFDSHQANELIVEEGRLTGHVHEPVLGKDAKVEALKRLVGKLGLAPDDAIAVGDGANDIPILKLAGLGVALHAKPAVREAAPIRIDHGDLTALLYLQGYRKDEFVG